MSAIKLANRYAKSLMDLAIERKELDTVKSDMDLIGQIVEGSRDFVLLLKSPIIHAEKKRSLASAVLKDHTSVLVQSFIDILIRKRREPYLVDVIASFDRLYNEYKGITPVKITSAIPLHDSFLQELREKIRKEANLEKIELKTEVDESLLGGFVMRYEDKLYDASVQRRLAMMKKEFEKNTYIKGF